MKSYTRGMHTLTQYVAVFLERPPEYLHMLCSLLPVRNVLHSIPPRPSPRRDCNEGAALADLASLVLRRFVLSAQF